MSKEKQPDQIRMYYEHEHFVHDAAIRQVGDITQSKEGFVQIILLAN